MRFIAVLSCLVVFHLLLPVLPAQGGSPQTHYQRTGANLVSNPSFDDVSYWVIGGDAIYDSAVSRTGSDSIRMTTPYQWPLGDTSYIKSLFIPVTPGKTYTYSFYMRTDVWPTLAQCHISVYNSSLGLIDNTRAGSRQGTTQSGEWQETAVIYTARSDDAFIKLIISRQSSSRDDGHIWIDDIYFGEGVGFEQPPSRKDAFDGAMVRVDELGNFEVLKDDIWTPLFPLCIFVDGARADWSIYSEQGFNCNMWGGSVSWIQKAKDAVSDFNPDGMMTGFSVAPYINPAGWAFNDITLLENNLDAVIDAGLMDQVLLYYWDNENTYDQWEVEQDVISAIRGKDVNGSGSLLHPIYMLQGNEGWSRVYNDLVDVVGDYAGGVISGSDGGFCGVALMDNIEEQKNPLGFGQITVTTTMSAEIFRRVIYSTIIAGGKGIGYWKDMHSESNQASWPGSVPVEEQPWWPELPVLRSEIDQLMPIIRQPHWTSWNLTSSSDSLVFNTRDYSNEGYVIVLNPTSSSVNSQFTISDLGYSPESVDDFFTGNTLASVSDSSFTVTIPAYGTAVHKLVRSAGSFDFSLSAGDVYVSVGGSGSTNIAVSLVSGPAQDISFSLSGLPAGSTGHFSQSSCTPGCSVTLDIQTSDSTLPGAYDVYVDGAGGGITRTTGFSLRVSTPLPVIPSARTYSSIVADGSGSEHFWSRVNNISFSDASNTDNIVNVRHAWDPENIYFLIDVYDPDIEATYTERDDRIWRDDGIEIFLDTANDKSDFMETDDFHFIINTNNALWDAMGNSLADNSQDSSWNSSLVSAVQTNLAGYVIELSIPWSDMNINPEFGNITGMLITNNDIDNSVWSYHSWNYTFPWNVPSLWGNAMFIHSADSSGNGHTDMTELFAFIDLWKYDSTSYPMMEVMEAVTLWSRGT